MEGSATPQEQLPQQPQQPPAQQQPLATRLFGHRRSQSHGVPSSSKATTTTTTTTTTTATTGLIAALGASAGGAAVAPPAAVAAVNTVVQPVVQMHEQISTLQARIDGMEEQLAAAQKEVTTLRRDNHALGEKLMDAREKQAEIAHANEMLTQEMNDLTEKLFQEANILVANEARRRFEAEQAKERLEQLLQQANILLQSENQQVRELREMLETLRASQAEQSNERLQALATDTAVTSPLPADDVPQPDSRMYGEFVQFVQQLLVSKAVKIAGMPFMRRCIDEDIEPTLQWLKKIGSKKIVDAYLENRCFLEALSEQQDRSLPESNVTSPISGSSLTSVLSLPIPADRDRDRDRVCSMCEMVSESLPFRFRLDETSAWKPIDQHCRDRLAAAGEFFTFIRYIKMGLYQKHTSFELFYECSRLRRQLLYVRLGFPLRFVQDGRPKNVDGRPRFAGTFVHANNMVEALLQRETSLMPHLAPHANAPALSAAASSPSLLSSKMSKDDTAASVLRRGATQVHVVDVPVATASDSSLKERASPIADAVRQRSFSDIARYST